MNTGSMLKIESNNFLMMIQQSMPLTFNDRSAPIGTAMSMVVVAKLP
jgi:hypothetical protein